MITVGVAIAQSIFVGIVMAQFNQSQKKREHKEEKIVKARRQETLLSLDMQMATAKLAYSVAMALKRGHVNGEVEDGISAYEDAKKKYLAFLNQQAAEHLL